MCLRGGALRGGGETQKGEKGESSSYIDSVNDCVRPDWFGGLNPVGLSRDLAKG